MKTVKQQSRHPIKIETKHVSIPDVTNQSPSQLTSHPTSHATNQPATVPSKLSPELMTDSGNAENVSKKLRTDEQLIAAYQRGDKQSFAELVSRYERELYHFLVRFLGDRAAAEDMFQETFLQIHQSAESFDPQRRFRPWMFTIAANKARDLMRSTARRPTNPLHASINGDSDGGEFLDLMQSSEDLPDQPIQKRELRQKVQSAVTSMPEHLREILLLSYFHQFPYQQISDILDIPLGTVKSRLHSAVAYFADRWKSANPGPMEA